MLHFERGSEWRRWDLHIHTPETMKNDQYKGVTVDDKWNDFYDSVSSYIGDGSDPLKAIEVIGITDYLSISNYLKVIADKRIPDTVRLILPNIELRMVPIARNSPINIHCIFDPNIVDELEGRFFSKLIFTFNGSSYSASHDELIRLGRDFKGDQTLSKDKAYEAGISQFVLEFSALKKVFDFDSELRNHCILVVSNSSGDGVSGAAAHSEYFLGDESQMDATRRAIYQFSDMIFSGNDSDIRYFIGEATDNADAVKSKCGSLKPCIHGSDAHSSENLFEPNGKKYCWIKADPTFNGLRQVLFEPKDRVRISQIKPETKPDYQVIDRVEICDDEFAPTPIYFNDKLTCIIGGKSTGKSLLLNNMALAIDPDQVKEKAELTGSGNKRIKDLRVFWRDGAVSQNGLNSKEHKVVYIPQTYLNRLSDEHEELTEIDEIIHDIVVINENAKSAYYDMNRKLTALKTEIDKEIYALIQQYTEWQGKVKALSEIGTRSGIEKEIKKLGNEKDKLSKELSLSDDDIAIYDETTKEISALNGNISTIEKNIGIINGIRTLVSMVEIEDDISDDLLEMVKMAQEKACKAADDAWQVDQKEMLKGLRERLDFLKTQLEEKMDIVNPLSVKISENEAIQKLTDSLKVEETKLIRFTETEGQANRSKEKYESLLKEVVLNFLKYHAIHHEYAESINSNTALAAEDLEFSVETPFRREAFLQIIQTDFDRRTSFKTFIDPDSCKEDWITEERIKGLINAIVNGSIHLTKNKTPESVLRELLGDWYNSVYRVSMDGDLIDEMSPGKKALVLLKMLISLAESTCPILVDQPEDDLDNRSIFDELIPFIKRKKTTRQVIVVTHNANVVLGADADEIIVANQDGKNSPNREFRFEYRTGSIEDDMPEDNDRTDTLGKQGIQQQICDILEGGQSAFDLRKHKYRI